MRTPAPSPCSESAPVAPRWVRFFRICSACVTIAWLFWPLIWAMKPNPHASCSLAGSYRPCGPGTKGIRGAWASTLVLTSKELADRLATVGSRRLAGRVARAGILALSACGGGGGVINIPCEGAPAPVPALAVLPPTATVYSGTPVVLTIDGGAPPYRAFSSNGPVL